MQPPTPSPAAAEETPLRLPWPCMPEGRRLLVLGSAPGARSRSLGRFLGAAFLGFGLLLLLVGVQQSLPPALVGGGGCIFAGLALLAAVRPARAPLAILDAERGEAVLCRRRLGGRAFRLFPLNSLEIASAPDGRAVRIRPVTVGEAGRDIPGLPSRISDKEWRQGMMLPTPGGDAVVAVAALERWQRLARAGKPTEITDACDAAEFMAILGRRPPAPLLQWLSGESDTLLPPRPDAESRPEMIGRPDREPVQPHPEIRRAPDLRDARGNRDKRE